MNLLERLMYHPNLIVRTVTALFAGGGMAVAGVTVTLLLVHLFR